MAEGCRGEAVKSAPRVLSRVCPSSQGLDVPEPVSLSQLDLRPEEHGGQERQTYLRGAHEVLTRAPRVSDSRLCRSSRRQAPSAFQLLFYNLRGPAGWVGYY